MATNQRRAMDFPPPTPDVDVVWRLPRTAAGDGEDDAAPGEGVLIIGVALGALGLALRVRWAANGRRACRSGSSQRARHPG
jgi:hypothetical protein